jgi:hypothetical protein
MRFDIIKPNALPIKVFQRLRWVDDWMGVCVEIGQ